MAQTIQYGPLKWKAYLQAYDLWELAEFDYELEPVIVEASMNQIKGHGEENARPFKALMVIQATIIYEIFKKIMTFSTPKEAWNKV